MLKLHSRFSKAFIKCKRQSRFLKCTNLLVTLLIVAVQVAQVCLCCMWFVSSVHGYLHSIAKTKI